VRFGKRDDAKKQKDMMQCFGAQFVKLVEERMCVCVREKMTFSKAFENGHCDFAR